MCIFLFYSLAVGVPDSSYVHFKFVAFQTYTLNKNEW